jgi:hypothetical protein
MFARTPVARLSEAANRWRFSEINALSAHLMHSISFSRKSVRPECRRLLWTIWALKEIDRVRKRGS